MLVLHVCWSEGAWFWAEDSSRTVTSRSEALRTARPHPFAAEADQLASIIAGEPATRALPLPSLRKSPTDSPELVRVTPRPGGNTTLLPWSVPMAAVAPSAVAEVLQTLTETPERLREVRLSASVRALIDIAGFATELVERGRVLPALHRSQGGAQARWRAVLTGPDAVVAHALSAALPPSFRGLEPDASAIELGDQALGALVDARARHQLPESMLPKRRGRAPARIPAAEQWLQALAAPDPRLHLDDDDDQVETLADQLAEWDDVGHEQPAVAGLVLRLRDPDSPGPRDFPATQIQDASGPALSDVADPTLPDSDSAAEQPWHLDFLLRSRADPSLLMPADQIWNDDGSLGRWLERPRELLLAELARAARVYRDLEPGLRRRQPT